MISTNFNLRLDECLMKGEENAKTQKELAEIMGCKPDEVKHTVQHFRREHDGEKSKFILSSAKGYFFSKVEDEKRRFLTMMQSQANARYKTIRQLVRSMDGIEGQQKIGDFLKSEEPDAEQ